MSLWNITKPGTVSFLHHLLNRKQYCLEWHKPLTEPKQQTITWPAFVRQEVQAECVRELQKVQGNASLFPVSKSTLSKPNPG